MKRKFFSVFFLLMFVIFRVDAQENSIKGHVTSTTGNSPLEGVLVSKIGNKKVVQTNANGDFVINANIGDSLIFSFTGFTEKHVIANADSLNVFLQENPNSALANVVVTALGIKRSERSIGYATQQIGGDALTRSRTDNLMNSLNGKIAGVTINPGSGGVGSSSKVVLRGNRSLSGNNQPLYVIDGVPMTNSSRTPISTSTSGTPVSPAAYNNGQPNSPYGGNDGGDGISNLNPDDIESMTVLEGASAAALYGSQAANGVIIITTKKGKEGSMKIDYSSNFSTNNVAYKPKFQNTYGASSSTSDDSWGDKMTNPSSNDYLSSFYQTGTNLANSISLSGGSKLMQTYFSYANTTNSGIIPKNKLERNNFNFRELGHFLNDKLTVDANINYITQKLNNIPNFGYYFNPISGLYLFPRGRDIEQYKNQYEFADLTGYDRQNWYAKSLDYEQNPWWIINRNPNVANRNRIIANASVKYDFSKNISLQARGSMDRAADTYEQDLYSGTISILSKANGQFSRSEQTLTQKYGDLLLNFKIPNKSKFSFDGVVGTSITDSKVEGLSVGPGLGLINPNVFTVQNVEVAAAGTFTTPTASNVSTLPNLHSQIQSVFGNLNFAYENWAFLTLSGRNDWSSNLSFAKSNNFFYPSVNLSLILNQVLNLPKAIDYFKLRGSVAQVGNTVPAYVTNIVNYLNSSGNPVLNYTKQTDLKPEKTNSVEAGTDIRMFKNRLSFSFTWYKSNTKNQFIPIQPAVTTGYGAGYVNAGNIQNAGIEFTLGFDVIKKENFSWNTSINASRNRNRIIDLDSKNGINSYTLTGSSGLTYQSILTKGGQFGDIYAKKVATDAQGRVLVTGGIPTLTSGGDFGGYQYVGNANPRFQIGWNNQFNIKDFTVGFLIDGKFGGQVMSATQAMMDYEGVSQASGQARDAGGVRVNGTDGTNAVTTVDARTWYQTIGNYKSGAGGEYIYSATVVRVREFSIGYNFPMKSNGVVKGLSLSVSGRNLLYISKKAPFDPEVTMSTGNGMSGIDIFGLPASRNIGLNLNVHL